MAIEIVDLPIKNCDFPPNMMTHMCPPTQGSSGMARYGPFLGLKRSTNAARKIDDATQYLVVAIVHFDVYPVFSSGMYTQLMYIV